MCVFSTATTSVFDSYVDTLLANGFTNLRVDIPDYENATNLTQSKAAVIRAVAKGAKVTWGVSSNNDPTTTNTITMENWPSFYSAIISAATWAQANGVFEFQLGNEDERHCSRYPTSIVRTSNVAVATFAELHGYDGTHQMNIWGGTDSSFNGGSLQTITVIDSHNISYPNTGTNATASNPSSFNFQDMSETQLQTNFKTTATAVKSIFTNGNVSYTTTDGYFMAEWNTLGRGDIDILGWNLYGNASTAWRTQVDNMVSWFGIDHAYCTELGINYTSINSYSTDEKAQAAFLSQMLEYIKASGIKRANFFDYQGDTFGALQSSGAYRQLWRTLNSSPIPVGFS